MRPQWIRYGRSFEPTFPTHSKLEPGVYKPLSGEFHGVELTHDRALVVEDAISAHVNERVRGFWAARDRYKRFNLLHKTGFLLEGAPGTGKTMTVNCVAEFFIANGGVVFFPYNEDYFSHLGEGMITARTIHPDLPFLVVLEDIDKYDFTDKDGENKLLQVLALLDGERQVGNVVFMATTNYIAKLDTRLTNRPSRFDETLHVGPPSAAARRSYLTQIVPDGECTPERLEAIVTATEGLLLSHMREVVAAHLVQGQPLTSVITRLHKMNETTPKEAPPNATAQLQPQTTPAAAAPAQNAYTIEVPIGVNGSKG